MPTNKKSLIIINYEQVKIIFSSIFIKINSLIITTISKKREWQKSEIEKVKYSSEQY